MSVVIEIEKILQRYPDIRRESLIPILQDVQDTFGFISEDSVKSIARYLNIPSSKIYGVATFYNQFRFTKKGKYHIQLCYGTACHVVGASTILGEIEKTLKIRDGGISKDGLFSLEVLSCIGGCGQAPVIAVNGNFYSKVTLDSLHNIFETCRRSED
jgi:NADH-quinone oxidoreductase E subunit